MVFMRIANGSISGGPSDLTGSWVNPADGTQYTNMAIWTEAERAAHGWVTVVDEPPDYNPASQALVTGSVALVSGVPTQQYSVSGSTVDQVNAIRDARLAAGFADSVTGKTIQCDDRSIGKLGAMGSAAGLAIVMAMLPAPQFQIVTADNSILALTPAQTFALLQGRVMPWVSGTWLYARTLKDQILAGQTPDITAGWP